MAAVAVATAIMLVVAATPVTRLVLVVPRSFPLAVGVAEAHLEQFMRAARRVAQQLLLPEAVLVPLAWVL